MQLVIPELEWMRVKISRIFDDAKGLGFTPCQRDAHIQWGEYLGGESGSGEGVEVFYPSSFFLNWMIESFNRLNIFPFFPGQA